MVSYYSQSWVYLRWIRQSFGKCPEVRVGSGSFELVRQGAGDRRRLLLLARSSELLRSDRHSVLRARREALRMEMRCWWLCRLGYRFLLLPVIVCLYTPGFNVLTSTLFTHTTCWWLELAGSHDMTALEQVMFVALTFVGPRCETSRPMIIVQAASLDVLRLAVTLRTLTRCGCNRRA